MLKKIEAALQKMWVRVVIGLVVIVLLYGLYIWALIRLPAWLGMLGSVTGPE